MGSFIIMKKVRGCSVGWEREWKECGMERGEERRVLWRGYEDRGEVSVMGGG